MRDSTTKQVSVVEALRVATQQVLDAERSSADRNRLGQFATPNALAREIVRFLLSQFSDPNSGIHFADPALGTGSFFSATLEVVGARKLKSAVGVEIDPRFSSAASELWGEWGLNVISADFTRIIANGGCPPAPNFVVANPPYVRHHHLSSTDKSRLRALCHERAGVEVNGLSGLYVYFLLLATVWMEDGGYAAWLVPSEFMDVNYGTSLKSYLTDRLTLLRVHRFNPDDVQFGDALVSSVVLVFKKAVAPVGHRPEFSFGGTLESPQVCDRVPLPELRALRKWTCLPVHADNDRKVTNVTGRPTLGDFFRIQRGIATGSNDFFILAREEAIRRGLPDRFLRPILPSPRHMPATVIEADEDGYPLLDRRLCVIDCELPEHLVEEHHRSLWEYLNSATLLGIRDGYCSASVGNGVFRRAG